MSPSGAPWGCPGAEQVGSWLIGLPLLACGPTRAVFCQPGEKPNCLKGVRFFFFKPLKFGVYLSLLPSPYRVIQTPMMCQVLF